MHLKLVTRIQAAKPFEPLKHCSPGVAFTSKRVLSGKDVVDFLAEPGNNLEPIATAQLREYLSALPPDD